MICIIPEWWSVSSLITQLVNYMHSVRLVHSTQGGDDLNPSMVDYFDSQIQQLFDQSNLLYESMLSSGVAKECAREVLPMASQTKLYMNGTLRSWLHYCQLRCGNGTQHEHRIIADYCQELIYQCFPMVYEAFMTAQEFWHNFLKPYTLVQGRKVTPMGGSSCALFNIFTALDIGSSIKQRLCAAPGGTHP